MNIAHLHLLMNHLPVIGVPISACFLAYAVWSGQVKLQRFSLLVLFIISLFVIPVYLSGEPTEKVVEHIPGISESLIEPHEEAAGVALTLTAIVGLSALVGLVSLSKPKIFSYAVRSTLILSFIATVALAYVANLGGQIRHSEIRANGMPADSANPGP